jgi:hypothetical protein
MRILSLLASLTLFSACGSVDSVELFTGVTASDQAGIRAAARAITNSPIVGWRLWPDTAKPTEVIFWTKEDKIYSAKQMGGKWHISDITNAIVRSQDKSSNQSLEPTAGRRDAHI